MVRSLLLLLVAVPVSLNAVTDGWTDSGSKRCIAEQGKILWRSSGAASVFQVLRKDGAEGGVTFKDGVIEIEKTNNCGLIAIVPNEPLECARFKSRRFRTSIRVECTNAQIFASEAFLSFRVKDGTFGFTPLDQKQWGRGGPRNRMLLNTSPGISEIKYAHVESDSGSLPTPALVLSGGRASVRCSDWVIEDYESAQSKWGTVRRAKQPREETKPVVSEDEFLVRLKMEPEHTGRVVRKRDRVVLEVDGVETPPVFYKTMRKDVFNKGRNTFGGKQMKEEAGVDIHVISIQMGRNSRYPEACWTKDGFNVKSAVDEVSRLMRITPDAKFVLSLGLDPYAEYADLHPEESWIGRGGVQVFGSPGHVSGPREFNEQVPEGKYRWVSISARGWREELKGHLTGFIAELKRCGLSHRIIGIHLLGFHDGQFAMSCWPDFSPSALNAFREFTGDSNAEIPSFDRSELLRPEKDRMQILWNDFIHRQPNRVMNDFARHIKKCFAKDIFAIRWCMSAFTQDYCGSFDIGDFTECDALDILVAQSSYGWRGPGLPLGFKLPLASFREHGKLFVNEFDFRTWNAFDSCMGSEASAMGLGCSMDFPMWNTSFHRAAGQMFAQGMGFWFYDMAGGWFDVPEIALSIREAMAIRGKIGDSSSCWRPNVALVVDERAFAMRNVLKPGKHPFVWRDASNDGINACYGKLCAAGVPYDIWLAEDLFSNPELATGMKRLVGTGMPISDARRDAFFSVMKQKGVTVVRSEDMPSYRPDAFLKMVKDAGGYTPLDRPGLQVDMNGGFISVHCLIPGRYDFKLPCPAKVINLKSGKSEPVTGNILNLQLVAGETCWFGFSKLIEVN